MQAATGVHQTSHMLHGLGQRRAMNHFHMAKATDKSQLACTESHCDSGNQSGSANCRGDGLQSSAMMMMGSLTY